MDFWLIVPGDVHWGFVFLTWDDGDGVFLPGHHADVLLDNRGDEALEDSDITPHGALVSHTDRIRLPEHWREKKIMGISECRKRREDNNGSMRAQRLIEHLFPKEIKCCINMT